MSTAVLNRKSPQVDLDEKIRQGKALLRDLRDDLEDRRELAAAKKRNNGKPGTPWKEAARELGID